MFDRLAIAALLVSCNQVYGLEATRIRDAAVTTPGELLIDVDRDGVSDEIDECIASTRDDLDDLDDDAAEAKVDGCPFDAGGASTDGDLIPNACDPFPDVAGDRLRCYMSFASTELNDLLWKPRDASMTWSSREGELFSGLSPVPSGYVSTIDLERAPQTTYEAFVTGSNGSAGIHALRLWSRAQDTFDNGDLGCEISGQSGTAGSTRVAIVRGNDADIAANTNAQPFPKSIPIRIAMTLAPAASGMNVRCTFKYAGMMRTVKARVDPVPMGRVAFGTENLAANISALAIYERADTQPLP